MNLDIDLDRLVVLAVASTTVLFLLRTNNMLPKKHDSIWVIISPLIVAFSLAILSYLSLVTFLLRALVKASSCS